MKKLINLIAIVALIFGASVPIASAAEPMLYCNCIDMTYEPAGPDIPLYFDGYQLDKMVDTTSKVETFCSDIGNLPYSVPFYGWFCTHPYELINGEAKVEGMKVALKVTLSPWHCCEGDVTPDDQLFWGGVAMTWHNGMKAYYTEYDNKVYVATYDGANKLTVHAGTKGVNTPDAIAVYVRFDIFIPDEPVYLVPPMQHMELE
jgi:hypothetical protein